jgi:hypothetical protein
MSWFKDFFSSGLSEVISSAGEAIDRLVTSDEERDSLKIELEKELNKFKQSQLESAANYDKEISQRHLADMTSDSWLSKNIRPLALSFLTISTVLLAYLTIFILDVDKISLIEPWLDLLQLLLVTTYAFYFGSRGFEKIQKIKDRSNK